VGGLSNAGVCGGGGLECVVGRGVGTPPLRHLPSKVNAANLPALRAHLPPSRTCVTTIFFFSELTPWNSFFSLMSEREVACSFFFFSRESPFPP